MGRLRADGALQQKLRYRLLTMDELRERFTILNDKIYHCKQHVNLQAGNGELILIQCKACQLTFINVLSPAVNGGMVFKDTIVYEAERVWAQTNPEVLKEGLDGTARS